MKRIRESNDQILTVSIDNVSLIRNGIVWSAGSLTCIQIDQLLRILQTNLSIPPSFDSGSRRYIFQVDKYAAIKYFGDSIVYVVYTIENSIIIDPQ